MTLPTNHRAFRISLGHLGQGLLPGALAAGAALIAFSGPDVPPTPLVAGILLLIGLVIISLDLERRLRWPVTEDPVSVLDSFSRVRAVIIVSTGMVLLGWGSSGDRVAGVATAVILLIGAVVLEPIFERLILAKISFVANLPGLRPVGAIPDLSRPIVIANLAAIAVGALCTLAGLPPWIWTVAALVSLVPAGLLVIIGRSRLGQSRRLERDIGSAVEAYAPEFVVYTSRPDDASYQVMMWLPYLQRAGRRFMIVTRDALPAQALAALTDVPIVVRRRVGDLDDVVPASLRAAFYVNASSGNGAFIRYHQLTHVYLGHGDSDKPPSYNPTHAMYDKIFAAGPAATRRYAAHGVRIPDDKFEVVGRPQVEGVQPAAGPIADVRNQTVLYAPTWRGHVEETLLYSLPVGERIVAELLERGATVIFRPHPFSYSFPDDQVTINRIQQLLAEDAARTGRDHLWSAAAESERDVFDCINASDAMVSDVSSVVSDYLFSGKPFAMVAVPMEPEPFVTEYPIAQAAYVLRHDLSNLTATLDSMLGDDPARERRADIRVDYLGDFPAEDYAQGFVAAVRQVSDTPLDLDAEVAEAEEATAGGAQGLKALRRELALVGRTVVVTGAALLSLVAGSLSPGSGLRVGATIATGLALASLLLMAVAERRVLRRAGHRVRLLTSFNVARVVLVLACGMVWWNLHDHPVWVLPTVCLQLVAITGEHAVADGWGRRGLEVSGLPQLRATVSERFSRALVPICSWSVLVLGWLMVLIGGTDLNWTAVIWFVLALVQFALFADALVRSVTRVFRVVAAEGRLRPVLLELAPEFCVYFSSSVGAAYQIGMWLPYLKRIDRPFMIVVRSVAMLREIAPLTDLPVIYRQTLRSLEDVIVPSLTTAFYVNNAVRNTHFVERRELTHVWLNHGDSEKPACYNPVHAIYDLLFAAGQAGIDRYARHGVAIPREKFQIVGRPQVEAITQATEPIAEESVPTVLYAPTWQGPYADSAVYSLPMGRPIVEALLARGCRVIFRSHPFNYRFPESQAMMSVIGDLLAADKARTGRTHLWGRAAEETMTIEDCFNASDAMISDVSAVVSDFLQSAKPFSIVSVGRSTDDLLTEVPAAKAAYVLRDDLANLDPVLDDLLHDDPKRALRDETRVYYLGDFPARTYADGFIDAARTVIDTPASAHA